MVKPGGTGRPMRHISARFAPLPPSSGFIDPLPSVLRPNAYTYLPFADGALGLGPGALEARPALRPGLLVDLRASFLAMCVSSTPIEERFPRCRPATGSPVPAVS